MNNKKSLVLASAIILLIMALGVTYAFFNYTKVSTKSHQIVAGDIVLTYNEEQDTLSLTNFFPETKEEARARNDNYITFTISGKNTSNKTINYEIDLIHGNDINNKNRINDKDLVFDLEEDDTIVVDAGSFEDISNYLSIWTNSISSNTTNTITRNYKLRMYLSDMVIISDTSPYANYAATGANAFNNYYASIKVRVQGDFGEHNYVDPHYSIARQFIDNSVMDNIASEYVQSESGINFSGSSNTTNGQGLYMRAGTENDEYPIAYYRGSEDTNNLIFANFCWRIIRTTNTGGLKILYNGPVVDGKCNEGPQYWDDVNQITMLGYIASSSDNFYYGTSYTFDNMTGEYTLSGDIVRSTPNSTLIGKYTCGSTSSDASCSRISYVTEIGTYNRLNGYSRSANKIRWIDISPFNFDVNSFAYVGYMYGTVYETLTDYTSNGRYYGSSFTYDATNNTYTLNNTTTSLDGNHRYSCNNTSGICTTLRYYYYSSTYIELTNGKDIDDAVREMQTNTNNSTIKTKLDSWFAANLSGVVNRLEDTIWCNDRSLQSDNYFNPNGGSIDNTIFFNGKVRYSNGQPSLACPNKNDAFTVSDTRNGNGALTYPVGLLTADEALLTRGFLNYKNFFTTTPYSFGYYTYWLVAQEYDLNTTYHVDHYLPVVPSISLSSRNVISSGDGTSTNPYIVE